MVNVRGTLSPLLGTEDGKGAVGEDIDVTPSKSKFETLFLSL